MRVTNTKLVLDAMSWMNFMTYWWKKELNTAKYALFNDIVRELGGKVRGASSQNRGCYWGSGVLKGRSTVECSGILRNF